METLWPKFCFPQWDLTQYFWEEALVEKKTDGEKEKEECGEIQGREREF